MLTTKILLLAPLLFNTFTAAKSDEDGDFMPRQLRKTGKAKYVKPTWWDVVESTYEGEDLVQKCHKRDEPPREKSRCSKSIKTCFFGTKTCPVVGDYPMTQCSCDGEQGSQKWSCYDAECPGALPSGTARSADVINQSPALGGGKPLKGGKPDNLPPPGRRDCPPESKGFEVYNDDLCPIESPIGSSEQCPLGGTLKCSYGAERCCGKCTPAHRCECKGIYGWQCIFLDSCMSPTCHSDDWTSLKGMTCDEAGVIILEKYPGMKVNCQRKWAAMPPKDDLQRYIIQTGRKNIVTNVIFNRNGLCPTLEDFRASRTCAIPGQHCSFSYDDSSLETASTACTKTDDCRCVEGTFICNSSAECVSSG